MYHPEFLAVIMLTLTERILATLVRAAGAVHARHFVESADRNPRSRWALRSRVFGEQLLIMATCIAFDRITEHWTPMVRLPWGWDSFDLLTGALLGINGARCGRRLSELLLRLFLIRNPAEIIGVIQLSPGYILKASEASYIAMVPAIAMLAIFTPTAHAAGMVLGLLAIILLQFRRALRASSCMQSRVGTLES